MTGIIMKAALIAIAAVVALAATSDLQAQQEPASVRTFSGDAARGPLAFSPIGQILVTGADGLSLRLRKKEPYNYSPAGDKYLVVMDPVKEGGTAFVEWEAEKERLRDRLK